MEYHLKPTGKTCNSTGKPLAPGSKCHSVIIEEEGAYVRFDYSEEGWSGPPENAIGHWIAIVPDSGKTKQHEFDTDDLMGYFEQLVDEPNPIEEQMAYVLALTLLRKRRLKLDGMRVDGEDEYLELSGSRGEGPFEVRDQKMANDEINALQMQLQEQLESEWG